MDVAAGTAGALAMGRGAVIVELERDPDHVIAGFRQQRRGDRGIHAARHGDDNARVGRPALDIETVVHGDRAALLFPAITIGAALRLRHGTGVFAGLRVRTTPEAAKFAEWVQGLPCLATVPSP